MPNFFKKLTSSFKMNEEDDIPEDEIQENDNPKEAAGEITEDNNDNEWPENLDDEEETAAEPEEDETEAEEPYTIAQLAKAQTAKRKTRQKENIEVLGGDELSAPEGQLAIDVYETPADIVIKSTIAGAKPEDLDIGIEDNTVNIRGSRHNEEKVAGENYLYQECYWGTFSRSVILPVEVDGDNAQATLRDGVLTIKIPKLQKEREKKIKILS